MVTKAITITVCLGLFLSLAGCTASTDPREGGLAGGLSGLGGAYDQRIQERSDSVRRLHEIQGELEAEQRDLSAERNYQQDRLYRLQQDLQGLSREITQLEQRVSRKRSQLASERAKQQHLRTDLADLQRRIDRLDQQAGSGADMAQLEAERDALSEEYRALLEIYLALGQ